MSGFDEVITLTPDDAAFIGESLTNAGAHQQHVRVAIDDGGLKFAVGRWAWTPPLGKQQK